MHFICYLVYSCFTKFTCTCAFKIVASCTVDLQERASSNGGVHFPINAKTRLHRSEAVTLRRFAAGLFADEPIFSYI